MVETEKDIPGSITYGPGCCAPPKIVKIIQITNVESKGEYLGTYM